MQTIYNSYKDRYQLSLTPDLEKALFELVAGNIQYLQLALILLNEKKTEKIITKEQLFDQLVADERINLESEELFESLTKDERKVLLQVVTNELVTKQDMQRATYV